MQPTVGRSVHYQRGGQTLHAVITRVERREIPESMITGFSEEDAREAYKKWVSKETSYDVFLAVFLHSATIGSVEFSPIEIPFSAVPTDKTWSWPPRVP